MKLRFVWLPLLICCSGADARCAEALTFTGAIELAEQQSPALAADASGIEVLRSSALSAGTLPNPKLLFGIDNLPATGPDRWNVNRDSMTMRRVGLMQEMPNGARRRADKAVAAAAVDRALAERRMRIATVRTAAAIAWLERHSIEQRSALLDELARDNQLLAASVRATLAGGRGLPADIIGPQQEAADLADRRDALYAEDLKARATLRQLTSANAGAGAGADADVMLAGEPPLLVIDAEQLRAHIAFHPALASYEPRIAVAQAELRSALAARKPDWGVEAAYARRAASFDDMVSLQFTLSLPLFTGSRQNPVIGAKRLELRRLELEREGALREHTAALEVDLADYVAIDHQLSRLHGTRLPLARQKVELQLASYRGGHVDLATLLAARRELIEIQMLRLELENRRNTAAARIHFSYAESAP